MKAQANTILDSLNGLEHNSPEYLKKLQEANRLYSQMFSDYPEKYRRDHNHHEAKTVLKLNN